MLCFRIRKRQCRLLGIYTEHKTVTLTLTWILLEVRVELLIYILSAMLQNLYFYLIPITPSINTELQMPFLGLDFGRNIRVSSVMCIKPAILFQVKISDCISFDDPMDH